MSKLFSGPFNLGELVADMSWDHIFFAKRVVDCTSDSRLGIGLKRGARLGLVAVYRIEQTHHAFLDQIVEHHITWQPRSDLHGNTTHHRCVLLQLRLHA